VRIRLKEKGRMDLLSWHGDRLIILISVASGFVIFPLIGIEKYFISLYAKRRQIYSKQS